jgi:hypothetical protein
MRKTILESEFDANWNKLWNNTQFEFFKCEVRQCYEEPTEIELLDLFRANKFDELRCLLQQDVDTEGSIWREAKSRGIRFIRIHVLCKPLSDYLLFELEAYKIQSVAGEEIYLVPWESIDASLQVELRDFMLFDRKYALVPSYDQQNKLSGGLVTDEPDQIRRISATAKSLLASGISLDSYISKHGGY